VGHDHDHTSGALSAGAAHRRPLWIAFCLIGGYFFVEVVAGFATGSLALLSDAGHMLTDVLGIGMALAAISLAVRHERAASSGAASHHTFGLYRLEVLAAFVNALLLFGVAIYVLVEAVRRLDAGPEVDSAPMLIVAVIGLAVNIVAFLLLRQGSKESLNVEGAYLEVVSDTLGSLGVIGAATVIAVTEWYWVDPVVGAAIGLWILPRTWRLGSRAVRVLVQSAPPDVDLVRLESDLGKLPDVVDVHDLHVWTLTSGMEAMSAHLTTVDAADGHGVLDAARSLVSQRYAITHATFQVEPECHDCDDPRW